MGAGNKPLRLVFTDLDGSLLDHYSYRFDAALPQLQRLREQGIPLIPVSSKTRSEIEQLRTELDHREPFIAENGAAVFIPQGYFPAQPAATEARDGYWVRRACQGRQHWQALLAQLGDEFAGSFESFAQAGQAGVMRMTGLDEAAAARANEREYSEPLQWRGSESDKRRFIARLEALGARVLQGGRFLAVSGECDKGEALAWLRGSYARAHPGRTIRDLAIGDSGNDRAMLEVAQTALLVRSPVHDFPPLARSSGVIHSTACGPSGWAEGVAHWLETPPQQQQEFA
ncbi:MAG: mannosyl-3-phosphoglycerate phosphatase [Halioglobus sp.]|nr:mannosyl-3-phosphoglycerate phosphatase [Halioglobus sp.]|tara:strand:+ start:906 stop:1763 length:858 start_codon:yes stop_codon:yes gene_type:complete